LSITLQTVEISLQAEAVHEANLLQPLFQANNGVRQTDTTCCG
jgi:hypothetical protein